MKRPPTRCAIRGCTRRSACSTVPSRQDYPINHGRPAARGPALGRYRADRYYSGGAYYFSTLAAAELCFRAATGSGRDALLARGDRYLETVRAFTPASGDMSEQFDQRTGEQTSAKHLAWSYAAFISCAAARRRALRTATAPASAGTGGGR